MNAIKELVNLESNLLKRKYEYEELLKVLSEPNDIKILSAKLEELNYVLGYIKYAFDIANGVYEENYENINNET